MKGAFYFQQGICSLDYELVETVKDLPLFASNGMHSPVTEIKWGVYSYENTPKGVRPDRSYLIKPLDHPETVACISIELVKPFDLSRNPPVFEYSDHGGVSILYCGRSFYIRNHARLHGEERGENLEESPRLR